MKAGRGRGFIVNDDRKFAYLAVVPLTLVPHSCGIAALSVKPRLALLTARTTVVGQTPTMFVNGPDVAVSNIRFVAESSLDKSILQLLPSACPLAWHAEFRGRAIAPLCLKEDEVTIIVAIVPFGFRLDIAETLPLFHAIRVRGTSLPDFVVLCVAIISAPLVGFRVVLVLAAADLAPAGGLQGHGVGAAQPHAVVVFPALVRVGKIPAVVVAQVLADG